MLEKTLAPYLGDFCQALLVFVDQELGPELQVLVDLLQRLQAQDVQSTAQNILTAPPPKNEVMGVMQAQGVHSTAPPKNK